MEMNLGQGGGFSPVKGLTLFSSLSRLDVKIMNGSQPGSEVMLHCNPFHSAIGETLLLSGN